MVIEREIQLAEAARIVADDTWYDAEDVVIDVDVEWLNSMKKKLDSTCAESSPSFTICRVPANICDSDHAAYSPKIISIGPFHRQGTNLQAMEEHKWRYLDKVLSRSKSENDLEKYLKEMKAKEAQARNCYSENFTIGINEFVEMMVIDGCFILQLIHEQNIHGAENNDPIHRNDWMFDLILHDMLLLENQLPFFVLEHLWELIGQPRATLRKEALTFFRRAFPDDELELKCPEEVDIHHLLHAVHLSLRPDQPARKPQSMSTATGKLPCAMWLQDAGITFRRKEVGSFFDVTFETGLMKMPRLWINEHINALFRNFIAFEQCFPEWGNHFTSYCFLIDALVNTPRDLSILTQSNIIEHGLSSDKEVALLFNKLCKDIVPNVKSSYVANMFEEVNRLTQTKWFVWRANLIHASVTAGIIILIATLVQTFFAVLAYFRPPKP